MNMMGVRMTLSVLLTFGSLAAAAPEVEYISEEKQKQLETLFNSGHFDPSKDSAKVQANTWNCEMYGMRTRMQVQRGLKLYKWTREKNDVWQNGGAQLVSEYKCEGSSLVGRRDRFEDQVKLTEDGVLISRLSLISPAGTVLAYSVCKTL